MVVVLLLAVSVGTAIAQEPVLISEDAFTGTAIIWDDQSLSDAITYSLTNVPAPNGGTEYVGWLVSDDGSIKLNTGIMEVADDGTVSSTFDNENSRYTGENLIRNYGTVVITEEVVGTDPDQPAGDAAFSYEIPPSAMAHIRHLLSDWPSTGPDAGILTKLKQRLGVALTHASLANDATTIAGVRQHLEHTINIIEGPNGPNYGDHDGDGSVQEPGPGAGFGVLDHAADRKHAGFASDQVPDDELIKVHYLAVDVNGANAVVRVNKAVKEALLALKDTDLSLAKGSVAGIIVFIENALNGVDADANNTIDSVPGEGGAVQAYIEAQLMATYTLQVGPLPTPTPVPTATPLPTATPAPPTATPVPPTATPAPPTATPIPPETVGDTAIPQLAQLALLFSMVFLVGGGLVILSRRPRA
jgi:hypothetical protein